VISSLVADYLVSLRTLAHDHYVVSYWAKNFMPFPLESVFDLGWFYDSFFEFFRSPVGLSLLWPGSPGAHGGWVLSACSRSGQVLAAAVALDLRSVGVRFAQVSVRGKAGIVLGPFRNAIYAGAFGAGSNSYPYAARL
jgi:hypothetical protein